MKLVTLFLSVVTGSMALASVDFATPSKLSQDLQKKVSQAVAQSCSTETERGYQIYETKTRVRSIEGRDGKVSVQYSTELIVAGEDRDGYHPQSTPVMVESIETGEGRSVSTEVALVYGCEAGTNYQCIADNLNMYNSSVYDSIDTAEIHKILIDSENPRHWDVSQAAISCRNK